MKTLGFVFIAALVLARGIGCSDSPPEGTPTTAVSSATSGSTTTSTSATSGSTDAATSTTASSGSGSGGGAPDCYMSPKTHVEIINACTDAQKVDKNPVLPKLNADGSLPPLP